MYRIIRTDMTVTIMLDVVLLFLLCFNPSRSNGEATVTEFLSNSSYSIQPQRSTTKYVSILARTIENSTKQSAILPDDLTKTTKEQESSAFLSTVKQKTATPTPSIYFDTSSRREETSIHIPTSASSYFGTFTTDTHPQGSPSKELRTSIPKKETASEPSTSPLSDSDIFSTGQEATTHPPGSSFGNLSAFITRKEATTEKQTTPMNESDIFSTEHEATIHPTGSSFEHLDASTTRKEMTTESQTFPKMILVFPQLNTKIVLAHQLLRTKNIILSQQNKVLMVSK
ncbi:uncharacterized protein LOC143225950 isoform X2 [Tachypleus tridentatus]|uniref:uncharacterized protein LOC143225950 isoform X2 n=1 Tax=Tachypleus tridentatus TaxID=6853 RepID=UPI003FD53DDC